MRLFIAVNLPAETRGAIHHAVDPLRLIAPDAMWVAADNLHITLKFLGEVPDVRVPPLRTALEGLAAVHRPFTIELGGVGAFRNLRAPRIVWMAAAQEPKLELLHHDVESASAALGYTMDGKAFRPHVTLARMRGPLGRQAARTFGVAARNVGYAAEVNVRTVDLMEATLTPAGSRYTLVQSAPLGGQ